MLSEEEFHETEIVDVVLLVRASPVGAVGGVESETAHALVLVVVVVGDERLPAASYASTETV